jgi:hypothetical protein
VGLFVQPGDCGQAAQIQLNHGEPEVIRLAGQDSFTSSVTTTNLVRELWPKEVVMAELVASRPVAISTRPYLLEAVVNLRCVACRRGFEGRDAVFCGNASEICGRR